MSEHTGPTTDPTTDPTTQPIQHHHHPHDQEPAMDDSTTLLGDPAQPVDLPVDQPGGRHPVNVGHLVMGVAFLGIVAVWALVTAEAVAGADLRWLLPLPWLAAGGAGLAAAAVSARRRAA